MKRFLVSAVILAALICQAAPSDKTDAPKRKRKPATTKKTTPRRKTTPKKTPPAKPEKPAPQDTARLYESSTPATPATAIDRLVFAELAKLGVKPVLCSDAVFVRRAYLDVIGTLPTAKEARAFIEAPNAKNKRTALIDRLLARKEFADYWSMRWGDILRIKAEFPVNLWPNAAQAYHRWIRASIAANKPYDQFAREMLTASGSNFRVGQVNFFRAVQSKTPDSIASAVALTFMGSRIDSWPKQRREGAAVFFSQIGYKPTSEWKEECVFWDPLGVTKVATSVAPGHAKPTTLGQPGRGAPQTQPATPPKPRPTPTVFPDGKPAVLLASRDPRAVFADWLITAKNPWFARCQVNRVWAWLLGRGIIHEPDDIREGNPASNPKLLAYLEKQFVDSGYDIKALYRLILTSRTYQLTSVLRDKRPQVAAQFGTYPLRRLDAEVLIDAINKITGTTDLYTSAIPEPFTYIPKNLPAIALADGSITSRFLTLFGRSARATGMANERSTKIEPSQWLHMLNSGHIQKKLETGPKLKAIYATRRAPSKTLDEIYLTVLSRFPTAAETQAALAYGKSPKYKSRYEWMDITWALLSNPEFLFRH